jgi:hypothetical protein
MENKELTQLKRKSRLATNWVDDEKCDYTALSGIRNSSLLIQHRGLRKIECQQNIIERVSYQEKTSKKYDRIFKFTGCVWLMCFVFLIIVSIIGYKYPNQKTGYTCLSCSDKERQYLETKTMECVAKKLNSISCLSSKECRDDLGLSCVQGQCQCGSSQSIWSNFYQTCKFRENETCSDSSQCCEPMNCTINGICQCGAGSYQYHDTLTLTCLPQQFWNNGSCSVDFNCRSDLYLSCQNGVCQCIPAFPKWSNSYLKCVVPKTYNQNCLMNSDCDSSLNLVCHDGTQNCSCPVNINNNYCDCIRNATHEYYWNGISCVSSLNFNQTCSNSSTNFMCKTLSEGTLCKSIASSYKCICPSLMFYNYISLKCIEQLLNNNTCTVLDACRNDLGLNCENGICQCNSTQFWNASACVNYYSYNQGSCSGNSQCISNLICKTSGVSCLCPTSVSNNKCDCQARILNNEQYWNGSQCIVAGKYGDFCTNDYQCQILTLSLICDTLNKICICSNSIYDASTQTCIPCISGWVFNNKSCFKGVGPLTISNTFESILQSDIGSMCSNLYTINVDLAVATDFNSYSIIDSDMCSNTNKIDYYFFGPIQSGSNCELYNCASGYDPSHSCSHYSSHGIICKYS